MLRDYFKEQIEQFSPITEDILPQIEHRRVWSGKIMGVGDKVLFAFVFPLNEDDIKMIAVLERELDELNPKFQFVGFEKETIPVLKFSHDPKLRKL